MKDKIIIALVSGGLALSGVIITQWFELRKRKSEENRWYADYFLPKKFDAIYNLYAELQKVHGTLSVYQYRKLRNDEEYQELIVKDVNRFGHAYYLANVYLSEDAKSSVSKFQDVLKEAGVFIAIRVEPIVMIRDGKEVNITADWPKEFDTLYKEAVSKIGVLLNPDFLKKLEQKKNHPFGVV